MKNLMIVGAGGLAFMFAVMFSGAVYWFAPINPCYITESDPYDYGYDSSQRETLCSGSEIHSYQYGTRDVSSRNGDASFFVTLLLIFFPLGCAGLTLIVANGIASFITKKKRLASAAT